MKAIAKKYSNLFNEFFQSEKAGGLVLIFCTVVSIVIANSIRGDVYIHFWHQYIDLSFSNVSLNLSAEHWINDALMAIFFLLVGLEIEREIYVGELKDIRQAMLPVMAAVGGMLVPALIHFGFNHGTVNQHGFAIPMATDIAFALGVLSLAGNRVPVSIKIFLTALAIIDDLGAILIIAFFYTKSLSFNYLAAAGFIFAALLLMNRFKVKPLIFYLLPGVVMWYCMLHSGVHATISGVLLAFAIPFNDGENNPSYRLQHILHKPVAFIIIPLFALANTAIVLPVDIVASLTTRNAMGIITGLLFGKITGIFLFSWFTVKLGWSTLYAQMTWKNLAGVGLLAGIGFTMSIFITNLAFNDAVIITSSKLSILTASVIAALTGLFVLLSIPKSNP